MNAGAIVDRVRYNVNDPNSDTYAAAEVAVAVNNAKDEVLDLLRAYCNEYPQASTTIVFATGDREKVLPSDFLSMLRVEVILTGTSLPDPQAVINFRQQDVSETSAWYIRRLSNGSSYLGRRYTDEAVSPVIYYVADVSDISNLTTATSTSYTFGPPPTNNLIVIKATIALLAARSRPIDLYANRERMLMTTFNETMNKINGASPRRITYIPR